MPRIRRMAAAVIVGVFVVCGSGCSREGGAAPTPTVAGSKPADAKQSTSARSSSAVTTAPKTPKPVPRPKKPRRKDFEGIDDFSDYGAATTHEYMVASIQYAYLTGDPSGMQDASAAGCKSCQELVADISDPERRVKTTEWKLDETLVYIDTDERIETYSRAATKTVWSGSEETVDEVFTVFAVMEWNGARWQATDLGFEDAE